MRRREGVIRALTHFPPPPGDNSAEDLWFHEGLFVSRLFFNIGVVLFGLVLELTQHFYQAEGLTYPHADVSQYFSIETIFAHNPLALHKVRKREGWSGGILSNTEVLYSFIFNSNKDVGLCVSKLERLLVELLSRRTGPLA